MEKHTEKNEENEFYIMIRKKLYTLMESRNSEER